MPLFKPTDQSISDREIPAERITYHVLAKGGQFYSPGDWRQLSARTGRTVRFVADAEWRRRYEPLSEGAKLEWERGAVPIQAKEDLPDGVVKQLGAEGHRVFGKVQMS